MFTNKVSFDASDCHMVVETQHLTRFDQLDNPFLDQIVIKLYDEENKYLARVTVMRIPSNQRVNASELYGTFYNMTDLMHNTSAELSEIADEMGLGWHFRTIYCRGGLDRNDLYQVVEFFVMPEYRRKGIGTWLFSNLQMMLSRITHDREPVCVLRPPRVVENGQVIFQAEPWLLDLMKTTGWNPVRENSWILYFNPMD